MFDILITNGKIVDGLGTASFKADLGIRDGKIESIGDLSEQDSASKIQAEGMIVTPGFIDVHTHSDVTILVNPKAESAVRQGVTTQVFPNCGHGTAPAVGEALKDVESQLAPYGLNVSWRTVGEYFAHVEQQKPSINVVPMVAHGTVRIAVLGYEKRKPTSTELLQMQDHVEEAMKSGARGLCSGLRYVPDGYANADELITLCKVVKLFDGIYTSHIRSEGDNGSWFDAITEAISIGEQANVPVQISHLKALGRHVWGKSGQALQMIDAARTRGLDVACDQYPYGASSSTLLVLFPQWAIDGGIALLFKRLNDSQVAKKIEQEFNETLEMRGGPEKMTISLFSPDRSLQGMTLCEVAEKEKKTPFQTSIDLLQRAEGQVKMIFHVMDMEDVRKIIRREDVMVASDGYALANYGLLANGSTHPRSYGCFPRVLAHFVREQRLLTVEQAVKKMTSLPAARFKLHDRGALQEGKAADLVIFDPLRIQDKATFDNPQQYPTGIHYVIVNGEIVVKEGEHTGAGPGRILRRNARPKT